MPPQVLLPQEQQSLPGAPTEARAIIDEILHIYSRLAQLPTLSPGSEADSLCRDLLALCAQREVDRATAEKVSFFALLYFSVLPSAFVYSLLNMACNGVFCPSGAIVFFHYDKAFAPIVLVSWNDCVYQTTSLCYFQASYSSLSESYPFAFEKEFDPLPKMTLIASIFITVGL
jgi:hypothetical protein